MHVHESEIIVIIVIIVIIIIIVIFIIIIITSSIITCFSSGCVCVQQEGVRFPQNILDMAITLTTNFSGAALTQLVSNVIVFCRMNGLAEPTIPRI